MKRTKKSPAKNKQAQALAALRWKKTSKRERRRWGQRAAKARWG